MEVTANPEKLRNEVEGVVRFHNGSVGGYTDLGVEFNLNALAIGLGLENIEYEPKVYPGLVYRVRAVNATVLLFEGGEATVEDAQSESEAVEAVEEVVENVRSLGLVEGLPSDVSVAVSKTKVDESTPSVGQGANVSASNSDRTESAASESDEVVTCFECDAEVSESDAIVYASNEDETVWKCRGPCEGDR